jgi:D-3-phosphoglycerate dehydrogenase
VRAVFVDANAALRALAEAIGRASCRPRARVRRRRHHARGAPGRARRRADRGHRPHGAADRRRAPLRRPARRRLPRAPARAATWTPEALASLGITVHLIKGYGDTAVAECAIGLLFDAARKFAAMDRAMRDGRWLRSEGTQLAGKTIGLIGYGGIAAEVARMALGIGMKVIAWNRTPKSAGAGIEFVPIERLLAESDAVSLHLLLTDETRGFLSAARIAAMRPGVLLVNTARGALLDEAAMVDALRSGRIGHAGLDVFTVEPSAGRTRADDVAERHPVRALGLPHAGGEHPPDRGGVRALRADHGRRGLTTARVRGGRNASSAGLAATGST